MKAQDTGNEVFKGEPGEVTQLTGPGLCWGGEQAGNETTTRHSHPTLCHYVVEIPGAQGCSPFKMALIRPHYRLSTVKNLRNT